MATIEKRLKLLETARTEKVKSDARFWTDDDMNVALAYWFDNGRPSTLPELPRPYNLNLTEAQNKCYDIMLSALSEI